MNPSTEIIERIFPSSWIYWIPRSISREAHLWIVITEGEQRGENSFTVSNHRFKKTNKRDAVVNRPSSIQEEEEEEEEECENALLQQLHRCCFKTHQLEIDPLENKPCFYSYVREKSKDRREKKKVKVLLLHTWCKINNFVLYTESVKKRRKILLMQT